MPEQPKAEVNPLKIDYGHSDTHVVLQFSKTTPNVFLTPEQAEAMVTNLKSSIRLLAAHQAKKKMEGANGSGK